MTNPTVQPVIHAIPIALSPTRFITFQRVTITPGVSLQRFVGPYARGIERQLKHFPENPEFAPTHLIVINQSKYYAALDQRLKLEGRALPRQELQHLDVNGITRQVLISTALVGRISWQIGGCHAINISNTSDQLRWSTPSGWFRAADGTSIQKVATSLDRYYRSGIWWNNRLSTALGYLWSALTTTHAELSFAALCMALEALATTANGEVTHILAERCALLSRQDGQARVQAYSDIKQLYALRSKIVHGRA